jgi:hypothetical protein
MNIAYFLTTCMGILLNLEIVCVIVMLMTGEQFGLIIKDGKCLPKYRINDSYLQPRKSPIPADKGSNGGCAKSENSGLTIDGGTHR